MVFALAKCSLKPVQQDEENANIELQFPFSSRKCPLWGFEASVPSSILPPCGGWESREDAKLGERGAGWDWGDEQQSQHSCLSAPGTEGSRDMRADRVSIRSVPSSFGCSYLHDFTIFWLNSCVDTKKKAVNNVLIPARVFIFHLVLMQKWTICEGCRRWESFLFYISSEWFIACGGFSRSLTMGWSQ